MDGPRFWQHLWLVYLFLRMLLWCLRSRGASTRLFLQWWPHFIPQKHMPASFASTADLRIKHVQTHTALCMFVMHQYALPSTFACIFSVWSHCNHRTAQFEIPISNQSHWKWFYPNAPITTSTINFLFSLILHLSTFLVLLFSHFTHHNGRLFGLERHGCMWWSKQEVGDCKDDQKAQAVNGIWNI